MLELQALLKITCTAKDSHPNSSSLLNYARCTPCMQHLLSPDSAMKQTFPLGIRELRATVAVF